MTKLYLVHGDKIVNVINDGDRTVTALPLLGGADAVSLINEEHLKTLALDANDTVVRAIGKLGLIATDAEVVASLEAVSVELGVG